MKTLATGLKRGEEPRWKEGAVWISDRLGRRLWQVGAAGAVFTEVPVTSNGPWALSGGGLAGATLAEKRIGIWDAARWAEHVDLSPLAPGRHGGDAIGNLYVVPSTPPEDVELPNGLALIDEGGTLVWPKPRAAG